MSLFAQVLKTDEQIAAFLSKYELFLTQGDKKEASRWLNEAATAHWERKEYPKAIEYFNKSLDINEELGNESGVGMINNNLGMIAADLRDFDSSLRYFQKTLHIRRKFGDKVGIQSALINQAVVLNNLKKYNESVTNLKEALDIAREMNDPSQMRSCYGMLAETYEKLGDVSNTLLYFNLYRSFHELVAKNEKKEVYSELEKNKIKVLSLENEKQKQELELLKRGNEITQQNKILITLDKKYQALYDSASKQEIVLKLIEQEAKLKQNELESKIAIEKNKENLLIIGGSAISIAVIVLAIFLAIIYRNNRNKQRLNDLLTESNHEIIRQKNELEKQSDALSETNKLKDKLFSVLAHDLRSPFATLESLMMLYEFEEYDQQQTKEFLSQIRSLSNSTLQTLENTLDWVKSQMSSGYELNQSVIALNPVTDEVINFLSEIAKSKKINIHNEIPIELLAQYDVNHFRIIIRNLISNAIKFTNEGGDIYIKSLIDDDKVIISVEDTGVGIPEAKVGRLFNTATHYTTQGTKHEKGTGLGLLLSKELVEKNNGEIWVESTLNVGTIFSFTLKYISNLELND